MPPIPTSAARRATAVTRMPNRAEAGVTLFDGASLNVDVAGYLSQHDVVYKAPPLDGAQGMPIGDGDLGAMVWCPERLQLQVQKSDLWADPPAGASGGAWRQPSAGLVSVGASTSFLGDPERFEQRLSLHSGVVSIQAENRHGACQVTTFVSATAGVLVVRYQDQSIRVAERTVDVGLRRDAHLFAMGETVGILQALRDRRYALLARVVGASAKARQEDSHRCSLVLDPARSADFTLYVAVATSPADGDPVAMARARIQAAIDAGFDRLLAAQRRRWAQFWEKSFLRLNGPDDDPLPSYLENLWYLGLYQQACCSRGFEAPLPNGGLWLSDEDSREGDALYSGRDLRAMLANAIPTNHLDLAVPIVDTCHRILPRIGARTGSNLGLAGARFPALFNRNGDEPPATAARTDPFVPLPVEGLRANDLISSQSAVGSLAKELTSAGLVAEARSNPGRACSQEVTEGLDIALLVWEAWRHAPDTFFLRERAYPLLRATTLFAIERCQTAPTLRKDAAIRSRLASALRALHWADREFHVEEDPQYDWNQVLLRELLVDLLPYQPQELQPFGALLPRDSEDLFRSLLSSVPQHPCGLFGDDPGSPDLAFSARLCAGLTGMMLAERAVPTGARGNANNACAPQGFGGIDGALRIFPALPEGWGGAFSLIAAGGFRVTAEAAEGKPRYAAIKSMLGGRCCIANPWDAGERVRVTVGDDLVLETNSDLIEFKTEMNRTYLIERRDLPVSRCALVRIGGARAVSPRQCEAGMIGIPAAVRWSPEGGAQTRLPAEAVVRG